MMMEDEKQRDMFHQESQSRLREAEKRVEALRSTVQAERANARKAKKSSVLKNLRFIKLKAANAAEERASEAKQIDMRGKHEEAVREKRARREERERAVRARLDAIEAKEEELCQALLRDAEKRHMEAKRTV